LFGEDQVFEFFSRLFTKETAGRLALLASPVNVHFLIACEPESLLMDEFLEEYQKTLHGVTGRPAFDQVESYYPFDPMQIDRCRELLAPSHLYIHFDHKSASLSYMDASCNELPASSCTPLSR
jgi:hypothetical protein